MVKGKEMITKIEFNKIMFGKNVQNQKRDFLIKLTLNGLVSQMMFFLND